MKFHLHLKKLVNLVARKKIIFVIVEGPSDEEALGVILSRLFNKSTLHVHIERQDITTQTGNTSFNIIEKVCKLIKKYAKDNNYQKVHFEQIIHITDTDGAYILSDLIIQNPLLTNNIYTVCNIQTSNKIGIERRNIQKSSNISKLSSIQTMWGLPYQIFYMSCNLDHVLYDKLNTNNIDKEKNAYMFAQKYKNDLQGFLSYINNSEFSVTTEYIASWNFIKRDNNSLKRYTNLGIVFKDIKLSELKK